MNAKRRVCFNGKFYAGGLNGVHRVADRLIRECDAQLAERAPSDRPDAVLLAPASSNWIPNLSAIRVETVRHTGQVWEQFGLARRRRDVLVSLANAAPILHPLKITMIHDVQFLFPDCGYTKRQRIGHRLITPRVARSSKKVVTVSHYSRQMLALFHMAPLENIEVIQNGADHILETDMAPLPEHCRDLKENGYVVMFGSPKPYKNNKVVFDAFARQTLDPLKLVIVGAREEDLANVGLQVPNGCVFTGRIDDGQLRSLLSRARALAFPSRTEGFGLPPLEAMLCQCPVVVSPAGAIPEACADAALYAGVDSPTEWQAAFKALATTSELRQLKIESGLARARRFTWRRSGEALMRLIDERCQA